MGKNELTAGILGILRAKGPPVDKKLMETTAEEIAKFVKEWMDGMCDDCECIHPDNIGEYIAEIRPRYED